MLSNSGAKKMCLPISHGDLCSLSLEISNKDYQMMELCDDQQELARQKSDITGNYSRQAATGEVAPEAQSQAQTKLSDINTKEKGIEMQLKTIETQRTALVQRYEATEKLIESDVKQQVSDYGT